MCQVQCKVGFDFGFTPPMLYLCSSGIWSPFSIPPFDSRLPWPDCSSEYEIKFLSININRKRNPLKLVLTINIALNLIQA